ncbi:MAG: hypothetical protein ACRC7N_10845 [Clostridium sp.]
MDSIKKASVIIKDDFNNILIIQKKTKKNEAKFWTFVSCDVKSKAMPDNAILKEINKQLKVTIFDLKSINILPVGEECSKEIFTGIIRESIVTHNEIAKTQWVKKDRLSEYDFKEEDIDILNLLK